MNFPMIRLIQIKKGTARRVAQVEEPLLRLLREHDSVYSLAQSAISSGKILSEIVRQNMAEDRLDYDPSTRANRTGVSFPRLIIQMSPRAAWFREPA